MLSILKNGGAGEIKRPNDFLIFHYPTGSWPAQTSLIKGDYKIVKSWAFDRVDLFNLRTDISEMKDLSTEMPEKAEELHQDMMNYLKGVSAILPPEEELEIDRSGVLMKKGKTARTGAKEKERRKI